MKIYIDPGHGGNDPGAVGAGGTREADITLPLAILLKDKLLAAGAEVRLSRTGSSENPSLSQRGKTAAEWKADLFISEHYNGAGDPAAHGAECYYSVDLVDTKPIAAQLSAAVAGVLGTTDRGPKVRESQNYPGEDYFTVVDSAQDGGVPVVLLIENGFITNPNEEKLLKDAEMQNRIAQAQAEVIVNYFSKRLTRTDGTPILGQPAATLAQARAWLQHKAPDWVPMADLYYSIAPKYGIRADIALSQAVKETGSFRFGGLVKPEQNNFCGLGATGPGNPGASFPDRVTGVEAHVQHLYAYATDKPLPAGAQLVDPRFNLVKRGTAPWVEWLGAAENPAGVGWAYPGKDYGHSIVQDYLTGLLATPEPNPQPEPEIIELRAKVKALESENAQLQAEVTDLQGIISQVAETIKKAVV